MQSRNCKAVLFVASIMIVPFAAHSASPQGGADANRIPAAGTTGATSMSSPAASGMSSPHGNDQMASPGLAQTPQTSSTGMSAAPGNVSSGAQNSRH
jgi:hypothetical protein